MQHSCAGTKLERNRERSDHGISVETSDSVHIGAWNASVNLVNLGGKRMTIGAAVASGSNNEGKPLLAPRAGWA